MRILRVSACALAFVAGLCPTVSGAQPANRITEFALPNANSVPYGIAKGPDGNMWFAEKNGHRIGRIDAGGRIAEFALPRGGDPVAIAAGPDGNMWFTENTADRIGRIGMDGKIAEFALKAGSKPVDITAGPDGALWFTEFVNKIGRIDTSGKVETIDLSYGCAPNGITSDGRNVWFTQSGCDAIGRMDVRTRHVAWLKRPYGSAPAAIAPGLDGNVWFSENGDIGRINGAGKITEFPLHGTIGIASGITLGPDGNMWFDEISSRDDGTLLGKVARITGIGTIVSFSDGLTPGCLPVGMAFGTGGNLWFTEYEGNRIGMLRMH